MEVQNLFKTEPIHFAFLLCFITVLYWNKIQYAAIIDDNYCITIILPLHNIGISHITPSTAYYSLPELLHLTKLIFHF